MKPVRHWVETTAGLCCIALTLFFASRTADIRRISSLECKEARVDGSESNGREKGRERGRERERKGRKEGRREEGKHQIV